MSNASQTDTTVGIVGGGPAGLMLSHVLDRAGIANVVIDNRTRDEIEHTVRAGILEVDSVNMLLDNDVSDRVLRDGYRHVGMAFDLLDRRKPPAQQAGPGAPA